MPTDLKVLMLAASCSATIFGCRAGILADRATSNSTRSGAVGTLFPIAIAGASELPPCGQGTAGLLVYVEADAGFSVCTSNGWLAIDLRGAPGAPGPKGDAGPKGEAGSDGAAGPKGDAGTAGATTLPAPLHASGSKVGIGVSSPTEVLDIFSPDVDATINLTSASTVQYAKASLVLTNVETLPEHRVWELFAEKSDAGTANGRSNLQIRRSSPDRSETITPLTIDGYNNVILSAGYRQGTLLDFGRVGIGTAAPQSRLHVATTDASTSGTTNGVTIETTYEQASGTASNTDLLIKRNVTATGSGGQYLIRGIESGQERFSVDTDGFAAFKGTNGGFNTINPSDGGLELHSGNDPNSYIDFVGSGSINDDYQGKISYDEGLGFQFFTDGKPAPAVLVDELNRVGIGSTSPQRTLHVGDAMRLEPLVSPPASAGLGDLYTDTSGALCFYNGSAWDNLGSVGNCL